MSIKVFERCFIFSSLSFFPFTLLLSVGFYFGVTSYFFLSFLMYVHNRMCICVSVLPFCCVYVCELVLNFRNATSRYFKMFFHFKNAYLD